MVPPRGGGSPNGEERGGVRRGRAHLGGGTGRSRLASLVSWVTCCAAATAACGGYHGNGRRRGDCGGRRAPSDRESGNGQTVAQSRAIQGELSAGHAIARGAPTQTPALRSRDSARRPGSGVPTRRRFKATIRLLYVTHRARRVLSSFYDALPSGQAKPESPKNSYEMNHIRPSNTFSHSPVMALLRARIGTAYAPRTASSAPRSRSTAPRAPHARASAARRCRSAGLAATPHAHPRPPMPPPSPTHPLRRRIGGSMMSQ